MDLASIAAPDYRLPHLRRRAYCHPVSLKAEPASDEELMLAYRDGDAGAFDALYRRHKGPLYRYLVRQCRDAAAAEELFQDIWLNLIRARATYTVTARFTTYLYRLAHNRLIDHYRRRAPAALLSFDDDESTAEIAGGRQSEPHVSYEAKAQAQRVLQVLESLPAAQREAFVLQHEAGMSIEEIAEATGVARETAKSRLRYAMTKLREGMREWL
jgi:RNA polymerase sigma-70 factor (ECF subfamily)